MRNGDGEAEYDPGQGIRRRYFICVWLCHGGLKLNRLDQKQLSYSPHGLTDPSAVSWSPATAFRVWEQTAFIGTGEDFWESSCADLMQWKVKTRSGFRVLRESGIADCVTKGESLWLVATFGPCSIREPIRIIEVMETSTRWGYSYGTLEGHPVSGEEAFVVHREDDNVFLTVRSLTRPGRGIWRFLSPLVLLAQRFYRRRYLRALSKVGGERNSR